MIHDRNQTSTGEQYANLYGHWIVVDNKRNRTRKSSIATVSNTEQSTKVTGSRFDILGHDEVGNLQVDFHDRDNSLVLDTVDKSSSLVQNHAGLSDPSSGKAMNKAPSVPSPHNESIKDLNVNLDNRDRSGALSIQLGIKVVTLGVAPKEVSTMQVAKGSSRSHAALIVHKEQAGKGKVSSFGNRSINTLRRTNEGRIGLQLKKSGTTWLPPRAVLSDWIESNTSRPPPQLDPPGRKVARASNKENFSNLHVLDKFRDSESIVPSHMDMVIVENAAFELEN
ncbi:hypothetical protein V6N13_082839 [Hibiscus sabdariffa]|uniref:Uncharacterized protein n=1 Tax=Hibiscus sabdariffa TaxID=183260 RepID=A0ABR2BZT5_9ROSI